MGWNPLKALHAFQSCQQLLLRVSQILEKCQCENNSLLYSTFIKLLEISMLNLAAILDLEDLQVPFGKSS